MRVNRLTPEVLFEFDEAMNTTWSGEGEAADFHACGRGGEAGYLARNHYNNEGTSDARQAFKDSVPEHITSLLFDEEII